MYTTLALQWPGYLPRSIVRDVATAEGAKAVLTEFNYRYNEQYHERKGAEEPTVMTECKNNFVE